MPYGNGWDNMITLTATIDILKSSDSGGDNGTLSDLSCNLSGNNISGQIGAIKAVKRRIARPFILGKSILGAGDTYCKELDYYMGTQLANEYGIFENPYTITINGSNITAITLAFDDRNNRFPKSIIIDGKTYVDDDYKWTIAVDKSDTHTIVISNWNTPNEPLILLGIYIDITMFIDRFNVTSIERTIMKQSDTSKPSWGIISNTGRIDFNDVDGEIKDYAEQLLLIDGLTTTITLNNTLIGAQEVIGVLKTSDWSYDRYSRKVSVSLKDDLVEWQDIAVEGINYIPNVSESKTAKDIYDYLYSKTPDRYKMYSYDELDSKTQQVLKNTRIIYPVLYSDNLWASWNKLCALCKLNIFKNNYGRTSCVYGGQGFMAIIIPSKNIYNNTESGIIRNNQINRVEIPTKKVLYKYDDNALVYDEKFSDGIYATDEIAYQSGAVDMQSSEFLCSFFVNCFEISKISKFSKKIRVPNIKGNGLITNIHTGTSGDGGVRIQHTIIGKKEIGTVSVPYSGGLLNSNSPVNGAMVLVSRVSKLSDTQFNIESSYATQYNLNSIIDEIIQTDGNVSNSAEIEQLITDNLATATAKAVEENGKKYWEINLEQILCSMLYVTDIETPYVELYTANPSVDSSILCKYEKYIAETIQININGVLYSIDMEDEVIKIGDGEGVFSFNGNELIQTTNTYNDKNASEYQAQQTINEYKNGKETATVLCSISDYYDANGNKIISIETSEKMCFDIGDIVIPYIYTPQGIDAPMSLNKDGTPKQFEVIGRRPYSEGAVWQELTLLEKTM